MSGSTSTGFAAGVKTKLGELYGQHCWHCHAVRPQMAHVFAKADMAFETCRRVGLVDLEHVDVAENGFPLCPSCHAALDSDTPLLIVVPRDLGYFIHMETQWQQRFLTDLCERPPLALLCQQHCISSPGNDAMRENSMGEDTTRQDTTKQNTMTEDTAVGGLYDCYMVEDFMSEFDEETAYPRPRLLCHTRSWHGDPKAIIWRARKKMFNIPILPDHLRDVKKDLWALVLLYDQGNSLLMKHEGALRSWSAPRPHEDNKAEDDDDEDEDEDEDRTPSRRVVQPSTHGPTPSSQPSVSPHQAELHFGFDNYQHQPKTLWKWGGPGSTTRDMVEYWRKLSAAPQDMHRD
jgi:hypothetical protein